MVLYSILAVCSRHQAILRNHEEHKASFYHGRCLRLVIKALSAPEPTYDDNLLTAVVLLRTYEELEQSTDKYLHLHGMGRLLASIPTFANSGGLAEAACWLSLRQDVFVSVTNGQLPTLGLENYEWSSAFKFYDDGACANVIVLIFAKMLRHHYAETEQSDDTWARLEAETNRWDDRRRILFQPVYSEDLDLNANRPFPVICMMNAFQGIYARIAHAGA